MDRKEYNKKYYLLNKDRYKKWGRKDLQRKKHKYKTDPVYRERILSSTKKYYWNNRDYHINYGREYTKKNRIEMLRFVGGKNGIKCKRCNFDDIRALQIDHVNGGGNKEIRTLKNNRRYLTLIKSNPKNYQLLCANCNWIKRHENHEGHAR